MPRVSKNQLSKELSTTIQKQFVSFISILDSQSEIGDFLNSFLTKEEKMMLSKRLMLYILIHKGMSPTKISTTLKMSRVSENYHRQKWNTTSESYKKIIIKLSKRQKSLEFWKNLDDLLYPVELMLRSGNDMRARAKLYQGDFDKSKKF